MDEITAWTIYHANILAILHHPGNRQARSKQTDELTDTNTNDYAKYLADLAIHSWRIKCCELNIEKNLSSVLQPSSEGSSQPAPASTATSPAPAAKPQPTPPTRTSTKPTSTQR